MAWCVYVCVCVLLRVQELVCLSPLATQFGKPPVIEKASDYSVWQNPCHTENRMELRRAEAFAVPACQRGCCRCIR